MTIRSKVCFILLLVGLVSLSIIFDSRINQGIIGESAPAPEPVPTSWIKQAILIEMAPDMGLNIWADSAEANVLRVAGIEGIIDASMRLNGHMIYARVDPRYSKDLVAQEITVLLSQPISTTLIKGNTYW